MDVYEFADHINNEIEHIYKAHPNVNPHKITKLALAKVVLQYVNDGELLCCLDINDSEKEGVTVCHETNEVCLIEGDAMKELIPEPWTCNAKGLLTFFAQTTKEAHGTDTEAYIQMDNSQSAVKLRYSGRNKRVHKRLHKYSKHRIRYKGVPWANYNSGEESDPCSVEKHRKTLKDRKNNGTQSWNQKKKLIGRNQNRSSLQSAGGKNVRRRVLHVVSPRHRASYCQRSDSSTNSSDNASDLDNLTDFCSICSSDSS